MLFNKYALNRVVKPVNLIKQFFSSMVVYKVAIPRQGTQHIYCKPLAAENWLKSDRQIDDRQVDDRW